MTIQQEAAEVPSAPAVSVRATPKAPDRNEIKAAFLYCLRVWIPVRVGLFMVGLLGVALLQPNDAANVPGWPAPALTAGWHNLITAWERWDALWYLKIAAHGYSPTDTSGAFFPLYPVLTRAGSFITGGHPLAGAFIVANVAGILALVVVYLMTKHEFDERKARQTVVFIAVFPTAYFLFAPYSESVFLLFAALSLYAARIEKWWVAGLAGALAAATRSIGVTLVVPLAFEAIRQARAAAPEERSPARVLYTLACSAAASLGLLAYLLYWKVTTGDFLTPFNAQNGWLREFSWPWETIVNGTKAGLDFIGSYPGGYHTLDLVLVALAFLAAVWLVFNWIAMKIPAIYATYALISLVMPLLLVFGGRPFMSLPRFVLVIWPLFWALGAFADKFNARDLVVGASAAGLGLMSLLFVNWYYVF
jgi:mannosyltransferase PIG-V